MENRASITRASLRCRYKKGNLGGGGGALHGAHYLGFRKHQHRSLIGKERVEVCPCIAYGRPSITCKKLRPNRFVSINRLFLSKDISMVFSEVWFSCGRREGG